MATLQEVLALAQRGVQVFPLHPGTKEGFVNDAPDHGATTDSFTLYEWFRQGGPYAGYNFGCWGGGNLLYIDVDSHNGGLAAWEAFVADIGLIDPTFTVASPRGGRHYYFRTDGERFSQAQLIKGKIDVRSSGGYVVGPGSEFKDPRTGVTGKYTIVDPSPIASLPDNLRQKLRLRSVPNSEGSKIVSDLDTPSAVAAARNRLSWASPAIQGQGGDQTTYELACALLDFGLTDDKAHALMLEFWNPKCVPPWDAEELRVKVDNAWNYRQSAVGRDNPEDGFSPIPAHMLRDLASPQKALVGPRKLLKYASEMTLEAAIEREAQALVKGLIYPGETCLLYGRPTAGKSFIMIDMGYAVAQRRVWHGRPTKQAPFLYVCLEGVAGFEKRILAATKVHGEPGKHFARLNVHVSLMKNPSGEEGARTIIEAYRQLEANAGATNPGIIAIDTYSRAIAGDNENDAADMMAFVEHRAGLIARETGAAVVVVHHPNKQGGVRGSSALEGACDTKIRAERDESGARRLIAEKVKDGQEGPLFDYDLDIVHLHSYADALGITSCVVKGRGRAGMSERDTECLEVTKKLMHGAITSGKSLSPKAKANNNAARWLVKNQSAGTNFTADEFKSALALASVLGFHITSYRHKGRDCARYQIAPALPGASADAS